MQKDDLEAAMKEMTKTYGDIERYFAEGLRIDACTIEALRSRVIE